MNKRARPGCHIAMTTAAHSLWCAMLALTCILVLWAPAARADFKIMTEELRPFGYTENGQLRGVCVDIVRQLLSDLGEPGPVLLYPWDRAYRETMQEPGRILFSMGRNEAREKLFKWVGPLIDNHTYLYKNRNAKFQIDRLEDARPLHAIAVRENYFAHTLLAQQGFENLMLTRDEEQPLKLLVAGRVDLIAVGELSLGELCRSADVDCSQVEKTGVILQASQLYMAFSPQTPDAEIARWQQALDALKQRPVFAEIVQRYLPTQP